ncbi:MAG: hypothetical protein KF862_06945 [Chitinophagaceae bacterium]|nr:hypothetical protein [Chitinophagaceae bacterium]
MSKSQLREVEVPVNKSGAPENKDDIDSRKREEFEIKGDDVTHNKKEGRRDRSKVKNNMAK